PRARCGCRWPTRPRGLRAEPRLLRPAPRHAEAPDITIGGQPAVRGEDGDRERDDAAVYGAQEPHVAREHMHALEPEVTPIGHGAVFCGVSAEPIWGPPAPTVRST